MQCKCGGVMEGDTCRWRRVSGDCCAKWEIEFRVDSNAPKSIDKQAAEAWNAAPRAANG